MDVSSMAELARTYSGAEAFALQKAAPLYDAFIRLLYPDGFVALALIGIAYWLLRLDGEKAWRYIAWLPVIVVLTIPVKHPGGSLPAALFYLNKVTTALLTSFQGVVDVAAGNTGARRGNYAAPLAPLNAATSGEQVQRIRDTDLAYTLTNYRKRCGDIGETQRVGLTNQELQAVALAGGALGVDRPAQRAARESALAKLSQIPRGASFIDSNATHGGFRILSALGWVARDLQPGAKPQYLQREADRFAYPGEANEFAHEDRTVWFAHNCADLFQIADLSVRQYLQGIDTQTRVATTAAGLSGPDSEFIIMGAQLSAAYGVNETAHSPDRETAKSSGMVADALNGLEAMLVTAAIKLVSWTAAFLTKYFVFLTPALASAAIGFMHVCWPLCLLIAMVPGRQGVIGEFVWLLIAVKVFLFLAYAILNLGGVFFHGAVSEFAKGDGSLAPVVLVGGVLTFIGVVYGAPKMTHALVFGTAAPLVSSMGVGAIAGTAIANTIQRIGSAGLRGAQRLGSRPPAPSPRPAPSPQRPNVTPPPPR
jgi:hypothetical protein